MYGRKTLVGIGLAVLCLGVHHISYYRGHAHGVADHKELVQLWDHSAEAMEAAKESMEAAVLLASVVSTSDQAVNIETTKNVLVHAARYYLLAVEFGTVEDQQCTLLITDRS
jgi:hypothetical protein